MLTQLQARTLAYIDTYQKAHNGISPSFDEIKDHLGIKSRSGISGLIERLTQRGFLRTHHGRARSIEILRLPAGLTAAMPYSDGQLVEELRRRGYTVTTQPPIPESNAHA